MQQIKSLLILYCLNIKKEIKVEDPTLFETIKSSEVNTSYKSSNQKDIELVNNDQNKNMPNQRFKSFLDGDQCLTQMKCDTCITSTKILQSLNKERWQSYECSKYTYRVQCAPTCESIKNLFIQNASHSKDECHFCFDNGQCDISTCDSSDPAPNTNSTNHLSSSNESNPIDNLYNSNPVDSNASQNQNELPQFNSLGGQLPDGTPKHVDLGNRRMLNRANHADMNNKNITDVDNVFDSNIPFSNSIRVDKSGDQILIPKKEIEKLRFKQLSKTEHKKMIAHIKSLFNSFAKGRDQVKTLITNMLESNYDNAKRMLKDDKLMKLVKKLKIDQKDIMHKFKVDDFELDEQEGFSHNLSKNVRNIQLNISEEADEMRELVDNFGI